MVDGEGPIEGDDRDGQGYGGGGYGYFTNTGKPGVVLITFN